MQRWEPRDGTMVAVPGGRWVLAADAVGVDAADLLLMHTREIEKLNTLPALLAVVEAAENYMVEEDPTKWRDLRVKMGESLAALRALEGGE